MSGAAEALDGILTLQSQFERGPKREGAFAVWLVARVAVEMAMSDQPSDKAELRRLELLERRVAPLAVPRPLARGLATALDHLRGGTPGAARIALSQLVAPAHDSLGREAGEVLSLITREIHQHQLDGAVPSSPPD
jgi:hypothetical protein